jgi:hypothetical protein
VIIYGDIFVNRQINMWKIIILTIFVVIGLGSWVFIMVDLFRNVIKRLKEKKRFLIIKNQE